MLLAVIAFVVYLLFLNPNSIKRASELVAEQHRLNAEIEAVEDSLKHYQELNSRLQTSTDEMERIVREQYHMQRPNEDIYIIR